MSLSAAVDKLLSLGSGTPDVTPALFELSMRNITRERMHYPVLSGAGVITAGTAITESPLGAVRQKSALVAAHFVPSTIVSANATNFLTIILRKRAIALPGTQVPLISFPLDTVTTDDITPAFARFDLLAAVGATLNSANFIFLEGDIMTLEVTKSGTGLALPIGDFHFLFEPRD